MLRSALRDVLAFHYCHGMDDVYGGYVAQLDERDGHVYDGASKHLVATARGVHNFSLGWQLDGPTWCRPAAERGLQFLERAHHDARTDGYDWLLEGRTTVDDTRYCYGHAFVLLAVSRAATAGIADETAVHRVASLLEREFWEPAHELYAAEATADWTTVDAYRGQNANMHATEALLAAYEATGRAGYLERAATVAKRLTRDLADSEGRIWEHYTTEWAPDFEYNRDEKRHTFRPWGYQAGHHVEWAKLLCLLAEHHDADWLTARAVELFDTALELGWDDEFGGFYYTVDREGEPIVTDKYGWPVAEAIGAAALLGRVDDAYWDWYDRLWVYAHSHFVSSRNGTWVTRLTREHERHEPSRGVAVEPGYHPVVNTAVALDVFA